MCWGGVKLDALYDPVSLLRRCTISGKGRNLQLTKSRDQNDPDYKRTICRENPGRIAVLVSRLVVDQCMCDLLINQPGFFHRREDGALLVPCRWRILYTHSWPLIHRSVHHIPRHVIVHQRQFCPDRNVWATGSEMLLSHRLGEA